MAAPTGNQLSALLALWEMAQRDHGAAKVVGKFLLSLYNGRRFPFDLTDLRCLDEVRFHQCLEVLRMDYSPQEEVHVTVGRFVALDGHDMGVEFEAMAYRLGMKGRCRKGTLDELLRNRAVQLARHRAKEGSHAVRA